MFEAFVAVDASDRSGRRFKARRPMKSDKRDEAISGDCRRHAGVASLIVIGQTDELNWNQLFHQQLTTSIYLMAAHHTMRDDPIRPTGGDAILTKKSIYAHV